MQSTSCKMTCMESLRKKGKKLLIWLQRSWLLERGCIYSSACFIEFSLSELDKIYLRSTYSRQIIFSKMQIQPKEKIQWFLVNCVVWHRFHEFNECLHCGANYIWKLIKAFYLLILDPILLITTTTDFSDLSVHSSGPWWRKNFIPTSRHRFQSNGTADIRRSAAHNRNTGNTSDWSFSRTSQPHQPDRPSWISSGSNRRPSHRHRLQSQFYGPGAFFPATRRPPVWITPPWWRPYPAIRLPIDRSPPRGHFLPPV